MKEIIQVLSSIDNILDKKTFNQLAKLVEAILSMTGRVTMLGMSRWSEAGASYRTIQRFLALPYMPWERINWFICRIFFHNKDDVPLIAGDEVVVTKSGKETFGVGFFFFYSESSGAEFMLFMSKLDQRETSSVISNGDASATEKRTQRMLKVS